jgi:hypothetical protein
MIELTFIAYMLSLVSLVLNIWLVSEIKDIRRDIQRDKINRRLNSITNSVKPKPRPRGHWG